MTVPVQTPVTSSIANGVTTVFPFNFKIVDEADLTVTVDGVVVTTGFTITGVGEDSGGDVTFDVAPANGLKVVRYSNPVLSRTTDYQQFGDWLAEIVNGDFDRIWLTLQSLYQALTRSIKLPVDEVAAQEITEDAAGRANKVITFDLSGNVALKAGTELIPEVDEAVTNALAAAAIAEASSSAASGFADDAEAAALAASTTPVAAPTHAAASKTTPVDADELPLIDSGASFGLKRLTWANLKATLKTYFDTLYNTVALVTAAIDTTFSSTVDNAATTPAWVNGKLSGVVFDWPGSTAPPGAMALPLVPTNVSRTTYARWFARFGTQFGVGDGSTTFGMPYCPENFAIIQANGNVGSSTSGQMPAHSHSLPNSSSGAPGVFSMMPSIAPSSTTSSGAAGSGSNNLAAGIRMLKCIWL